MNLCTIYDFETLSTRAVDGIAINVAGLSFDADRFTSDNPYSFDELVSAAKVFKFDVKEQQAMGRKVMKDTLDWWQSQPAEVRAQIKPDPSRDRSVNELRQWMIDELSIDKASLVFSRGNNFDPVLLETLLLGIEQGMPYSFWKNRDTRSVINGMTWGHNIKDTFIPEGIEGYHRHNSEHDIALDVLRMQYIVRL